MKLGGNRPPGDNPLLFSTSGTGYLRKIRKAVITVINVAIYSYIIHSAQPSNLIGPFVPRDRPEKMILDGHKTILDGPPGNHRNNVKIAILDVRLTQIRQTRKDDNVSG